MVTGKVYFYLDVRDFSFGKGNGVYLCCSPRLDCNDCVTVFTAMYYF